MKNIICMLLLSWLGAKAYAQPLAKHVVVIGVDGLNTRCFQHTHTPHLDSLVRVGSSTFQAQAVLPSYSSPNWASMLMGVTPAKHRITSNVWKTTMVRPHSYCGEAESKLWPTIFRIARRQELQADVACFYQWKGLVHLIEEEVFTTIQHTSTANGTALIAGEYIRTHQPRITFIHLDDVDHTGHHKGWDSVAYLQAVEKADSLVGLVLRSIRLAGIANETIVLVTSDHGGKGRRHGGNTPEEVNIPWIIAGPGITSGKSILGKVHTYDTAATLAYVLGYQAPDYWLGKPVWEILEDPVAGFKIK